MIDHIKELNKAISNATSADQKARAMLQLATALVGIDLEKSFHLATEAGGMALKTDNLQLQGHSYKIKSLYYTINSQSKEAMECLTEAVKLYRAVEDNDGLAAVTMNMGIVKMSQAAYVDAMIYYRQAVSFYMADSPNPEGLAKCYNNMGIVYEQTGEYEQALAMFENSIQQYHAAGLIKEAENPEGNIALVYKSLGWSEQALEKLLHCLEVYGNDLNKIKYTATLLNIGDTYLELDNEVKALDYFKRAFKSAKAIGHKRSVASSMMGLGKVFNKLRGFKEANKHFNTSLQIYNEINEPDGTCAVYFSLGESAMNEQQYGAALQYFETALAIALEHGFQHQQFELYRTMVDVYNAMGRYDDAGFMEAKSLPLRMLYKS